MFHICVNGHSEFRAESIKVALNLWALAKTYRGYSGSIDITDENGKILYHFTKHI
jgi:hypothetical protein